MYKNSASEISKALQKALDIASKVIKENPAHLTAEFHDYKKYGFKFEVYDVRNFYEISEGEIVYLERIENEHFTHRAHFRIRNVEFYINMDGMEMEEFRRLFDGDYHYIPIKRNIYDMTIRELIEGGARLDIGYDANNESHALEISEQFERFGEFEKVEGNSTDWLSESNRNLSLLVFYKEDER